MPFYGAGQNPIVLYGAGFKYGGLRGFVDLYRMEFVGPERGLSVRHLKLTLKQTLTKLWNIHSIRLLMSPQAHTLPKYLLRIERLIKRTKVTLRFAGHEMWRLDSIRLRQKIKNRRPQL